MVENWVVVGAGLSTASFLRGFANASYSYPKDRLPRITVLHHSEVSSAIDTGGLASISGKRVGIPGFFSSPPGQKIQSSLANGLSGSQNFGGWSQGWGATWHPPFDSDLAMWPEETRVELIEQLRAVEKSYSVVGPWRTSTDRQRPRSPARVEPSFLENAVQKLPTQVSFSASSLFLAPLDEDQSKGCNQCGQCLTGCPAGHIWNAQHEISDLQKRLGFEILPNFSVTRVIPSSSGFLILGFGEGEQHQKLKFDRVFLAAGPLQTATILLRSDMAAQPVEVRETSMFAVPFVRSDGRKTAAPGQTRIGLSEAFLTENHGKNPDNGPRFFSQLYGDSGELRERIMSESRFARILPTWLQATLFSRIGIAMVFVRQDKSPLIRVSLDGDLARLDASPGRKPFSNLVQFAFSMLRVGLVAFLPFLRSAPPGHSYHLGASFPLAGNPENPSQVNKTNVLGEPNGHQKIHLIDGSSLPIVPPTPVSGLVMANNFRIARAVLKDALRG